MANLAKITLRAGKIAGGAMVSTADLASRSFMETESKP
jgi:hypothetical protein